MDSTNWNAKINWKMRSEIEYQWDLVEEVTQSLFSEFERAVSECLVKLKEYINSVQAVPDRGRLVNLIELSHDTLKYALAQKIRETRTDLRTIRFQSYEATCFSYIVDEMIPAYREASCQYGTGKRSRQEAIIQGHGPRLSFATTQHLKTACAKFRPWRDGPKDVIRQCCLL